MARDNSWRGWIIHLATIGDRGRHPRAPAGGPREQPLKHEIFRDTLSPWIE
jgi:hypothetical protein